MAGKKILLTGASAGIGKAAATSLIAKGHHVWGTSRSADRLIELAGLNPLVLDLNNPTSINAAMHQGLTESGGFDVVINNAGSAVWGPVESLDEATEAAHFQMLVFGPMQIIRAALPAMRAARAGTIINVTSLAARFPVPFLGTYSACKAALSSLTWALQMELLAEPIRFVDLQPGDICSDFQQQMSRQSNYPEPYTKNLKRALAVYEGNMRTAPSPDLVARAITTLVASNGSRRYTVKAVGSLFQARIAPFLSRFAIEYLKRQCTSQYYRLRSRR